MKFLVYGFLVAFGLGAIAAPVVAGLLGAAGLAGSPAVRRLIVLTSFDA